MYYDRPGTRTVKPNATGRMPLKNAICWGFWMDGTFNVIKSSYYSPEEGLLLPRL
jgi:hypothetical protein